MTVPAMPPQIPTNAIHLPAAGAWPVFIAPSSSQPTIAAGIPVKSPQQSSPAPARINAVTARELALPAIFCCPPHCCFGGAPITGPSARGVEQLRQKAASSGFDWLQRGQNLGIVRAHEYRRTASRAAVQLSLRHILKSDGQTK